MSKLTAQQEQFAREFVRLGNASRAYRAAYKPKPNTPPESIWSMASRVLANVKVRSRVAQLRDRIAEETIVNGVTLVNELEVARVLALELERPSAAVSASMGKARVTGHLRQAQGRPAADKGVNSGITVSVTVESSDAGLF